MDFRGSRSHMIGEGQGTAPSLGPYRSLQSFKQILRVSIRNGKNWDACEGLHIFQSQALGIFGSSYVRSKRIARMDGHIHDAAALHSIRWTPRSLRKHITFKIAVIPGIGVD